MARVASLVSPLDEVNGLLARPRKAKAECVGVRGVVSFVSSGGSMKI